MESEQVELMAHTLTQLQVRPERRRALQKKWRWSAWRLLPTPIAAYLVTGTWLWLVNTPDAWLRALGPVLTVLTFLIMRPLIWRTWIRRQKAKSEYEKEDSDRTTKTLRDWPL